MIDTTGAFIQSASAPAPHSGFKQVLNQMLVDNGELTRKQFDTIGEVQARTAVLATLFDHGTDDQKTIILSKFEGKNRDRTPSGKPDLNGAMFGLNPETAVSELDEAINALGLENKDELIAQSLQGVHAQKGVHDQAASAVVITKALYFADYDRADKQAIFDAALVMQLSMRSLDRVESFLAGDYNRQAALELLQTSNKLNYRFDHPAAIDANEALLSLSTSEMQASTMLERNEDPANIPVIVDEIRGMHGYAAKRNVEKLINAMEDAVSLFHESGKHDLADKATDVFAYYNQRYDGIMNVPHIMMAPEAKTGFEGPDPSDQLN